MVHEQKFKDLLSTTCQVSVERTVLDLESEVIRALGSIPTRGNIVSVNFFSKCTRMAIMSILASEALFRENKKFQ